MNPSRPQKIAIGLSLIASVVGITTANYDVRSADLTPTMITLPKDDDPNELGRYRVQLFNYSETNANDVIVQFSFWSNGLIIHTNHFRGRPSLPAKDGSVWGHVEVVPGLEKVDFIQFCISYRGRLYFDRVVSKIRIVEFTDYASLESAIPIHTYPWMKMWGTVSDQEKSHFNLRDDCDPSWQ